MNETAAPIGGSSMRQRFRARLLDGPIVMAPGIYDAFGARLVECAGYEAAYLTGNGVSAALLGQPDVGLVDLSMLTAHARHIVAAVSIPLICDADTGYGNAVNVRRTVEEFEAAGVAAIHIEDQVMPKRCAHLPGARELIPIEEHAGKIQAAVAARLDPNFVIIARTDAAPTSGLDEAIRRAACYHEAGADAIFVDLRWGSEEDLRRLARSVNAPLLVNVEEQGTTGAMSATQLERLGYRIAIYPGLARYAAGFAIRQTLSVLKKDGSTQAARDRMLTFKEYNEVLRLQDVEDWERRYLPLHPTGSTS